MIGWRTIPIRSSSITACSWWRVTRCSMSTRAASSSRSAMIPASNRRTASSEAPRSSRASWANPHRIPQTPPSGPLTGTPHVRPDPGAAGHRHRREGRVAVCVGHHRLEAARGDQPAVGRVQCIAAARQPPVGAGAVGRRPDDPPIVRGVPEEGSLQVQMPGPSPGSASPTGRPPPAGSAAHGTHRALSPSAIPVRPARLGSPSAHESPLHSAAAHACCQHATISEDH